MVVYDVVIGKTLPARFGYTYIENVYTDRFESEEITTYKDLAKVIYASLTNAFGKVEKLNVNVDSIIAEFGILENNIDELSDQIAEVKIRELLSALSYAGFQFYLLKRPDLMEAIDVEPKTRAYMIDKQDSVFPALTRVGNGMSLVFNDVQEANISTVVMTFLEKLGFNPIVEDIIDLNTAKQEYSIYEEAHMGYNYNAEKIIKFLDDYGYNFIVVVQM